MALSEFRYQMRRFERFSENAAHAEGITPLQYLLLLHIKGFPGREWATVGELAERLQAQQHGVVALLGRCEAAGLVQRRPNAQDRRRRSSSASARPSLRGGPYSTEKNARMTTAFKRSRKNAPTSGTARNATWEAPCR